MIIEINPKGRFTYINQMTGDKWPEWKTWETLTEEEKQKVNLGIPSNKYLMLDKDLKGKSEEEINAEWLAVKQKLIENRITSYVSDRSPEGFHVFIPFKDLDDFDEKLAKEIRKIYINKFECDLAKSSMNGVISLPRRPHFKTGKNYDIIEITTGINELNSEIIEEAKIAVEKNKNYETTTLIDKEFKSYFEKDPFFNYLANNIIPDSQERNNVIFPNLAIACARSGKTKEEIDALIKPIIAKNFPGKVYAEFEGWLKKAFSNQIDTYNLVQLNTWAKNYTPSHKEMYDLTPMSVEDTLLKEATAVSQLPSNEVKKRFYSDKEIEEMITQEIQWCVDKWIAKGDICFVAGKAASYKTSALLHMMIAISEGKLVFNTYQAEKCKVLYLNEENNMRLFKSMLKRIKKGLDLEGQKSENIYFSVMENFRLENPEDIKKIVEFVKAHDIKVLVFDSFRRFFVGKENDADVINKIFNTLKVIRKLCDDITIIAIHHAKKDQQGAEGNSADIRDILRGSSDIVNSADSVIGIKRKIKQASFVIEHIKNRSGEEIVGKVIKIEGLDEDKMYFYEVGDVADIKAQPSKPDNCAEKIMAFLETNRITNFVKADLKSILVEFSEPVIRRALHTLKTDGVIIEFKAGPRTNYVFNLTQENVAVPDEPKKSKNQQELL